MLVRLEGAIQPFTPSQFIELGDSYLRSLGVTRQKSAYLLHLAASIVNGDLSFTRLARMSDDDWQAAFELLVLSHVRAVRAALPNLRFNPPGVFIVEQGEPVRTGSQPMPLGDPAWLERVMIVVSVLSLILLAIILFILEVKIISHGILTIGGVISMLIGSLMLFESPAPFLRVSLSLILPAVLITSLTLRNKTAGRNGFGSSAWPSSNPARIITFSVYPLV